jgi:4-hydroxyphenylacetate decarboxylase small subunit
VTQPVKKHSDCENFAPVDVAKGICRLTNTPVLIDSSVCAKFEAIPKCSRCTFFKNSDRDGIGTCTGLEKEYWTAGNYNAGLCEGYVQQPKE